MDKGSNPFVLWLIKYNALESFFREYLSNLDLLILRCCSKTLKGLITLPTLKTQKVENFSVIVAASEGHFLLASWLDSFFPLKEKLSFWKENSFAKIDFLIACRELSTVVLDPLEIQAQLQLLQKDQDLYSSDELLTGCVHSGNLELVKTICGNDKNLSRHQVYVALIHGKFPIIQWYHSSGIPVLPWEFEYAFRCKGNLPMVEWIWDRLDQPGQVHPHNFKIISGCIGHTGDVEVLKWCLSKGFKMNKIITKTAADQGNFEILKFWQEKGFPFSKKSLVHAIKFGDIEILKWLVELGLKWDEKYCYVASSQNVPILNWAMEHGCTCSGECVSDRMKRKQVSDDEIDVCYHEHSDEPSYTFVKKAKT